ncbi:glycoside hydrolase family 43 protein [Pyronema omphalodes]|nr:glycoside hydrolase family 43 protein [Pyronema omphalodes]
MQLLSILTAALTAIPLAAAWTPGACSGYCRGVSHDPSVARRASDGTYFRFSTNNKINIATAPSISGPWTYQGPVLPSGSKIDQAGNQDLWAPDIIGPISGYYYLTYSVSTFGKQNSTIGIARSRSMAFGSWTDLGSTGISSHPGSLYNTIDSNLISTESGYVMTFGSYWGDIYQVPMTNPPTKATKNGATTPKQIAYWPNGSHDIEAGFVFKKGKYHYLFFSQGQCCGLDTSRPPAGGEYKVMVCRSSAATGPFVDRDGVSCREGGGTIVLQSQGNVYAPGGQSVFEDPGLGSVIVYHYVDTTVGYADGDKNFGWNVLDFSSGWPVAV